MGLTKQLGHTFSERQETGGSGWEQPKIPSAGARSGYSPLQPPPAQTRARAAGWELGNAWPKPPAGEGWKSNSCHGWLQGTREMKQVKGY